MTIAVGALIDSYGRTCRVAKVWGPCRCPDVLDAGRRATEDHFHIVAHDIKTGGILCISHLRLDGSSVLGDRPFVRPIAPPQGAQTDLFA